MLDTIEQVEEHLITEQSVVEQCEPNIVYTAFYKHGLMNPVQVTAKNELEAKKIALGIYRKNYIGISDFSIDEVVDKVIISTAS